MAVENLRATPAPSGPAPRVPGLVSFVVIAFNEQEGIRRTLRSILAQRAGDSLEVIVVDDGSRDATPELVTATARVDPRVRLLELGANRGRGHARQAGVEATRGEFIATVDADIVLGPDWLQRCLQALHDADADAVGGRAVPDGDAAYHYRRFRLPPRVGGSHSVPVTGANAVFRAEVFVRVAFDRSLREGEDVALNHALADAGTRMFMVPGLTVLHEETKSFVTSLRWMLQSGRGAERMLRTYRRVRMPDLVYLGFLGTLALAAGSLVRRRRAPALLLPAYLTAAAAGHVRGAYLWRPRRTLAYLAAIVADVPLLLLYFIGRMSGPPPVEAPVPDDHDGIAA